MAPSFPLTPSPDPDTLLTSASASASASASSATTDSKHAAVLPLSEVNKRNNIDTTDNVFSPSPLSPNSNSSRTTSPTPNPPTKLPYHRSVAGITVAAAGGNDSNSSSSSHKKVLSASLAKADRPPVSVIVKGLETRTAQDINEAERVERERERERVRRTERERGGERVVGDEVTEPSLPKSTTTHSNTTTTTTTTEQPSSSTTNYTRNQSLDIGAHLSSLAGLGDFSPISPVNLHLNRDLNHDAVNYQAIQQQSLLLLQQQSASPPSPLPSQQQKQQQKYTPPSSLSSSAIQHLQSTISTSPTPLPPLVRTTSSHSGPLPIRHPVPDIPSSSLTTASNIATLEATAVRLSMTSSIDDAIRDLHSELKRSDSHRSSIHISTSNNNNRLRAKSFDSDASASTFVLSRSGPGKSSVCSSQSRSLAGIQETEALKLVSSANNMTASSTTNIMEMDPVPETYNNNNDNKLYSTSSSSIIGDSGGGRDNGAHGRTPSFVVSGTDGHNGSEMTSLGNTVWTSVGQKAPAAFTDNDGNGNDSGSGNTNCYSTELQKMQQEQLEAAMQQHQQKLQFRQSLYGLDQQQHQQQGQPHYHSHSASAQLQPQPQPHTADPSRRPSTISITSTQSKDIFGDFDGVHCDPYMDIDIDMDDTATISGMAPLEMSETINFAPPADLSLDPGSSNAAAAADGDNEAPSSSSVAATPDVPGPKQPPPMNPGPAPLRQSMLPSSLPPARPQSYMDPMTGQPMEFYPARVPVMLNLPQKLSKKPKARERNAKQSAVLSMMPTINKEAAPWLNNPTRLETYEPEEEEPEHVDFLGNPLAGIDSAANYGPAALTDGLLPDNEPAPLSASSDRLAPLKPESLASPVTSGRMLSPSSDSLALRSSVDSDGHGPAPPVVRRHKKRASKLPPQLRATVFFEMPSTTTDIKIQNGSASETLNELLDASATAPVSAFTDHLVVRNLGVEVYGRNRKSVVPDYRPRTGKTDHSSGGGIEVFGVRKPKKLKKRGSQMSMNALAAQGRASAENSEGEEDDGIQRVRRTNRRLDLDGSDGSASEGEDNEHSALNPAGEVSNDEEGSDHDAADQYYGPPTTLLAELQLRKQQQKLRTKNRLADGLHSTLLELDAVAEKQRQNRLHGKVNLAWEEGADTELAESEDEDVPLGVLYATKKAGTKNLGVAVAELVRPMGLMEMRELEEKETLGARRQRLMGGGDVPTRSQMNPVLQHQHQHQHQQAEEEEEEDEPLAARRARLKGEKSKTMSFAGSASVDDRPDSSGFARDLLAQFAAKADDDNDSDEKKKSQISAQADSKKATNAPFKEDKQEEEETLGQRRKRLQAEREVASASGVGFSGHRSTTVDPRLSTLLAAHPVAKASPFYQAPSNRSSSIGGHMAGGFCGGVYNTGGIRASVSNGNLAMGLNGTGGTSSPYGGMMTTAASRSQGNLGTGTGTGTGYGMGMQMNPPGYGMPLGGRIDAVERWRQGVQ